MNRCARPPAPNAPLLPRRAALRRLLAGAGAASLALLAAPAHAQARVARQFPMGTRRGEITFTRPPQVQLNDHVEQLGPGTRIHDAATNRLVFASTLRGQTFTVNYVRDSAGTVREIWILTPHEIEQKLPTPLAVDVWREHRREP